MSQSLVMSFVTSNGGKASISVSGVKENISSAQAEALMNIIIENNYFNTKNGELVAINSAKVVEKNEKDLISKN